MSESQIITLPDLGFNAEEIEEVNSETLAQARARADKQVITDSLRFSGNNISAASRILKISRLSLYRLIDKYQISH